MSSVDCFRIQWILCAVDIVVIRHCFVVTFEGLSNSEIAIDFVIKWCKA